MCITDKAGAVVKNFENNFVKNFENKQYRYKRKDGQHSGKFQFDLAFMRATTAEMWAEVEVWKLPFIVLISEAVSASEQGLGHLSSLARFHGCTLYIPGYCSMRYLAAGVFCMTFTG